VDYDEENDARDAEYGDSDGRAKVVEEDVVA
jgi:hypothetical protein